MFLKERLIDRKKSVDAPIKKTTISYQELQMMQRRKKKRN